MLVDAVRENLADGGNHLRSLRFGHLLQPPETFFFVYLTHEQTQPLSYLARDRKDGGVWAILDRAPAIAVGNLGIRKHGMGSGVCWARRAPAAVMGSAHGRKSADPAAWNGQRWRLGPASGGDGG